MCKHWTVLGEDIHPCLYQTPWSCTVMVWPFLLSRALWSVGAVIMSLVSVHPCTQVPPQLLCDPAAPRLLQIYPFWPSAHEARIFTAGMGDGLVQETQWRCTSLSKVSNEQFYHRQKQHRPLWIYSAHEWEILLLDPLYIWFLSWWEQCTGISKATTWLSLTPLTQDIGQLMYSCHYTRPAQLDLVSTGNV